MYINNTDAASGGSAKPSPNANTVNAPNTGIYHRPHRHAFNNGNTGFPGGGDGIGGSPGPYPDGIHMGQGLTRGLRHNKPFNNGNTGFGGTAGSGIGGASGPPIGEGIGQAVAGSLHHQSSDWHRYGGHARWL